MRDLVTLTDITKYVLMNFDAEITTLTGISKYQGYNMFYNGVLCDEEHDYNDIALVFKILTEFANPEYCGNVENGKAVHALFVFSEDGVFSNDIKILGCSNVLVEIGNRIVFV